MIELERYQVVPEALLEVPEDERNLFLAFGSAANEILLLQKLILCNPPNPPGEVFLHARLTHTLVLYRLLAGKLHEAWELLRKSYFATKLSRTYDSSLSSESEAALRALKRYHSGTNAISRIRHEFSFHFPSNHFNKALQCRSSEPLVIYLSPFPANCLFYCSEQLTTVAILEDTPNSETLAAFRGVIDDAVTLAGHWLKFMGGYLTLFVARNRAVLQDRPESIEVHPPCRAEVSVPWFFAAGGEDGAPNQPAGAVS